MVARWGGVLKGAAAGGGGGGGAGGTLTAAFLASDAAAASSAPYPTGFTFSGLSFGTAAANRLLVATICIGTPGQNQVSPSTVTIGGVSATKVVEAHTGEAGASIWQALVPSGTSGSLIFTTSGNLNAAGIGLWSVKTDTQGATNSGSSITGAAVAATVPASGYGIVAVCVDTDTRVTVEDIAPINYTEDFDTVPNTTGTVGTIVGGGHLTTSASIDFTASQTPVDQVLVYASWSP